MNLDKINWGGSGIERCLYDYVVDMFPKGTKMLEIGGGDVSTKVFSDYFTLTTIEQSTNWIGKYKSNYIYAPLLGDWYNPKYLINITKDYKIVFVDGPSGDKRHELLNNLEIFNVDAVWIFHDIYRETERKLSIDFANKTNKQIQFFEDCDYWAVVK